VIGVDLAHGLILIEDNGHGLVVDIRETTGTTLDAYTPRLKDLVMITGNLCLTDSVSSASAYRKR
jgi:hypothetical protein